MILLAYTLLVWFVGEFQQVCCKLNRHNMSRYSGEYKLRKYLFDGYESGVLPVQNHSQPVMLNFEIAYTQIVELDERNQYLSSNIWIRQIWKNYWMVWNPEDFENISQINVKPQLVWTPDVVLYNNADGINGGELYEFNTNVIMRYDGTAQWYAPTLIKSQCKIDIMYFPFDNQSCQLTFGSWTYTGNFLDVSLSSETADLARYTKSGEWDLLSVKAKKTKVFYKCCAYPYIDITYHVNIRRKPLFYINNLIVPSVLLACLTAICFLIPPECGERISLSITILLGMTVFMLIFTENLPPNSEVTPLIGKYFTLVLLEISFSLVATSITLGIYHGNMETELPDWLRVMIFRGLAPLFRMTPPPSQWHDSTRYHNLDGKDRNNSFYKSVHDVDLRNSICRMDRFDNKLDKITETIVRINSKLNERDDTDTRKSEWIFVCRVLDRLFFYVFSFTIATSTIIILFGPTMRDPR